ncbi:MAG: bifunctional glutamate N-acetyltransferase/amino-acid acetyltransferase ArgJ [Pelagibacterales bacterium]|nr:bifunctional glutamate N-acetyltransferase/amino-acid acetyltransferase ArgJ [Pelagibacterales bacterium]
MPINIKNFLLSKNKKSKIGDFQDLGHIDGVAISAISANLYKESRDDLVLFYFRDGANYASVYTQSKIISENIKWNLNLKTNSIKALLVNSGNANAFTGKLGFKGITQIAEELSKGLTIKMSEDDEKKNFVKSNEILFGSTGTIGETFPAEKIKNSLPDLLKKIKYTQNKYLWMKAALGIMTTDLVPKLAMEECTIGNSEVKIYGVAKGSGMIFPNMATTLGYVFTDADIPSGVLKKLLKKNIETTFNAISCDGDTSTNDMVTFFATKKTKHPKIKSINDEKLQEFDKSLHSVLLSLAKRIAADGEGASKFISVKVRKARTFIDAKKVAFSIANSPLVKTAIAGEDPNWGRIIMAIGKANVDLNLNKLAISFGHIKVIEKGQLFSDYEEAEVVEYMRGEKIDLIVDLNIGNKDFTAYTMDLTKEYIEINADYRS